MDNMIFELMSNKFGETLAVIRQVMEQFQNPVRLILIINTNGPRNWSASYKFSLLNWNNNISLVWYISEEDEIFEKKNKWNENNNKYLCKIEKILLHILKSFFRIEKDENYRVGCI